jgi:hypothetical protein
MLHFLVWSRLFLLPARRACIALFMVTNLPLGLILHLRIACHQL